MPDRNDSLFDLEAAPPDPGDGAEAAHRPAREAPAPPPEPAADEAAPDLSGDPALAPAPSAPSAPPPAGKLLAVGAALALVAAIAFDTMKLREAKSAVDRAAADLAAARDEVAQAAGALAAARAQSETLRAAGARDGCERLANYLDGDGIRMLPLRGEGRGKGGRAQFYLPPAGEGCLIATGKLPDGPLALWQLTGGSAQRLARLRDAGGARLAAATLAGPKGKLVVAPDPDPASALPGGEALLIGAAE